MSLSINVLPWAFWIVALVASVLYAAFAVRIFVKAAETPPKPWLWHQRWLYFLASVVGWLAAWLLFVRHCGWPIRGCSGGPDWWDVAGAIVAFLGMTGYLPFTILGVATGARALGGKIGDVIIKLLPTGGSRDA